MVALVTMVTKLLSGHVYPSHPLVFTSSTQITQSSSHQAVTTLVGMVSPSAAVLPLPPLGTTWIEAAEGESDVAIRGVCWKNIKRCYN